MRAGRTAFYGVRQRAAEVLKETGTAAALRGLATLLDRETDPRALQFIGTPQWRVGKARHGRGD